MALSNTPLAQDAPTRLLTSATKVSAAVSGCVRIARPSAASKITSKELSKDLVIEVVTTELPSPSII